MTPRTRLLHLSDLHIGAPFHAAVASVLIDQLKALDVQGIIISGDLTQRARHAEFAAAADLVRALPVAPRVVVPGNHDVPLYRLWERLLYPRRNYGRFHRAVMPPSVPPGFPFAIDIGGARVVALDSTAPRIALKGGRVSQCQVSAADALFKQAPEGVWKLLVMHHNLVSPPGLRHHRPMPRARVLLEQFDAMGVDLVLNGHLHHAFVTQTLDIHPGWNRGRGMVLCNCGTTTSRRGRGPEREKNSFNLLTLDGCGTARIEHWVYFDELGRFEPVSEFSYDSRRA